MRGEGCRVFDDEGRSYLDLIGGIAVNSLGHCHPAIVRAIREQCGTLMHVSNLYRNPWSVRLAEELAARVPGARAFFCNSGAEANEAAIKLARRHAHFTYGAARHVIITAEASFHGRTFAALTATGQPKYREGFEPLVPGFRYVPYGDLAALDGRRHRRCLRRAARADPGRERRARAPARVPGRRREALRRPRGAARVSTRCRPASGARGRFSPARPRASSPTS